jgi:hypothetical protein
MVRIVTKNEFLTSKMAADIHFEEKEEFHPDLKW